MRPRILVTHWIHDEVLAALRAIGDVDANAAREPWPLEEVLRRAAQADAMLAFMTDVVGADFLAACPQLKIVACALKGFDNFDLAACERAGVWVSIVPDLLTAPTAELAVGLSIALGRMIREGDGYVRSGAFDGWRPVFYGAGLDGATAAIVGMGEVGRAIGRRLSGFGCELVGVDPDSAAPPGIRPASLHEALAVSDVIILAIPLTEHTRHMIDARALRTTKRTALLVNVGRGSVVDESAVADALESGHLGGYAADVFELEDWALPNRPRVIDARLLAHPRTLFTPHLGSAVDRVRLAIAMRAAGNIADALAGRRPRDAINRSRAEREGRQLATISPRT